MCLGIPMHVLTEVFTEENLKEDRGRRRDQNVVGAQSSDDDNLQGGVTGGKGTITSPHTTHLILRPA